MEFCEDCVPRTRRNHERMGMASPRGQGSRGKLEHRRHQRKPRPPRASPPRKGRRCNGSATGGKTAMIESIEQDYEGNFHVCVVADDDPGRDIGIMRQPGHRFFFDPEEIEPLPMDEASAETRTQTPSILIAGI